MMLGGKTTCKDRWRQVLSEANRIPSKHLVTPEAAISKAQLEEMRSHALHLVIPSAIHAIYPAGNRGYLMTVQHFIQAVQHVGNGG